MGFGMASEELAIVVKRGLEVISLISPDAWGPARLWGLGTRSIVSGDLPLVFGFAKGGGLGLLQTKPLESSDESGELSLVPPCRRVLRRVDREVRDLDSCRDGISALCSFMSKALSVVCRLKVCFMLLPLLPARLLFTLTFPSIILAGGGG